MNAQFRGYEDHFLFRTARRSCHLKAYLGFEFGTIAFSIVVGNEIAKAFHLHMYFVEKNSQNSCYLLVSERAGLRYLVNTPPVTHHCLHLLFIRQQFLFLSSDFLQMNQLDSERHT